MPQQYQHPSQNASNDYLNFGEDAELADLNLDFLQNDINIGGSSLMQNNQGNNNIGSDENVDDAQMDELFTQFDDIVNNGI